MRASSRAKISNAHSLLDVGDARSPGHHREEKEEGGGRGGGNENEGRRGIEKDTRETGHSREDFEPRGERVLYKS